MLKFYAEAKRRFQRGLKLIQEKQKIGDTYVGIKGENVDGSIFFEKAFESGANACIIANIEIEEEIIKKYQSQNKIIIKVENTVMALHKIAKYKRQFYNIPVVGITGSVGKTSTKDLIGSVMSQKYNTLKTRGNCNSQIRCTFNFN